MSDIEEGHIVWIEVACVPGGFDCPGSAYEPYMILHEGKAIYEASGPSGYHMPFEVMGVEGDALQVIAYHVRSHATFTVPAEGAEERCPDVEKDLPMYHALIQSFLQQLALEEADRLYARVESFLRAQGIKY